jgi:predicted PurR-regulated permease PerM
MPWLQNFGVALIPVLVVALAQLLSAGVAPTLLSPVELAFAMLSASTILAVQLRNISREHRAGGEAAFVVVLMFIAAFTATASAVTITLNDHRVQLTTATHEARSALAEVDDYLRAHDPKRLTGPVVHLEDTVTAAQRGLAQGDQVVGSDAGFSTSLITTILLSLSFLVVALAVWRRV